MVYNEAAENTDGEIGVYKGKNKNLHSGYIKMMLKIELNLDILFIIINSFIHPK